MCYDNAKAVLNTPEFRKTHDLLATKKIDCIQDYGENGFKGVLVETICLFVDTNEKPNETKVESIDFEENRGSKAEVYYR